MLWPEAAGHAADAITLTLGGRIREFFFAADQRQAPGESLNTASMFNDVRVSAEGKTVLDNGVSIRSYVRALFAVGRAARGRGRGLRGRGQHLRDACRMGEKAGVNASTIGDPVLGSLP